MNRFEVLRFRGNELNRAAYTVHIPALQARGTTLYHDPGPVATIPDENLRAALEAALGKSAGGRIRNLS